MSSGAKEKLIKSVAQAIPMYVMIMFKLPVTLCEELEQLIRYFWWGEEKGQRKMHWVAWEKLLQPKRQGGLGFRDLRKFNQALLARESWRLLQFPDSLYVRVLDAKYYPNGELVDTVFLGEASPMWRAIEYGLELLKKGIIWRISSRMKVNIWRDPWIVIPPSCRISLKKGRSRLRWISELMKEGTREWDEQITPKNPHTEYISFDVVDMPYPYNTIFVQGLLNTFEAALDSGYLCLKIPTIFGVLSVFGRSLARCQKH
jgi:hypothetical protein